MRGVTTVNCSDEGLQFLHVVAVLCAEVDDVHADVVLLEDLAELDQLLASAI
jgi:hypothetical protein